jgi:hypothetical protein
VRFSYSRYIICPVGSGGGSLDHCSRLYVQHWPSRYAVPLCCCWVRSPVRTERIGRGPDPNTVNSTHLWDSPPDTHSLPTVVGRLIFFRRNRTEFGPSGCALVHLRPIDSSERARESKRKPDVTDSERWSGRDTQTLRSAWALFIFFLYWARAECIVVTATRARPQVITAPLSKPHVGYCCLLPCFAIWHDTHAIDQEGIYYYAIWRNTGSNPSREPPLLLNPWPTCA